MPGRTKNSHILFFTARRTRRDRPYVPRRTESSVRKEAEKIVETAAEEVKPVAEAAPKKKKGFSPFKGFGKKKEA